MEITFKYFAQAKAVKGNGIVVSFHCWGDASAENETAALTQIVQIIKDHADGRRMVLVEAPVVKLTAISDGGLSSAAA